MCVCGSHDCVASSCPKVCFEFEICTTESNNTIHAIPITAADVDLFIAIVSLSTVNGHPHQLLCCSIAASRRRRFN